MSASSASEHYLADLNGGYEPQPSYGFKMEFACPVSALLRIKRTGLLHLLCSDPSDRRSSTFTAACRRFDSANVLELMWRTRILFAKHAATMSQSCKYYVLIWLH